MGEGGCCGKGVQYNIKGAFIRTPCQAKQEGRAASSEFLATEKTSLIWNEGFRAAKGRLGMCGMKARGWHSPVSREVELQMSDHGEESRRGTWGQQPERDGSQQAVRCPWDGFSYLLFSTVHVVLPGEAAACPWSS